MLLLRVFENVEKECSENFRGSMFEIMNLWVEVVIVENC